MILIKLKMSAAATFVIGAALALATCTVGLTQERRADTSPTTPDLPRIRALKAALEKPVSIVFRKPTALDDVLKSIKQVTSNDPFPNGVPIYLDPVGLQDAEKTLLLTITINAESIPLKDALAQVLAQLGLEYAVKDGVLIISSPSGIVREQEDAVTLPRLHTPSTKSVLARLDEPISMSFANETPLEDLLKYVTQATTNPTDPGIAFVVDAFGLQEVGMTLASTISIDLEGVPLKTTLRLLLRQLRLTYTIKDGLVVISSPKAIQELLLRMRQRNTTR